MVKLIEGFEKTNIIGLEIEGSVSAADINMVEEAMEAKLQVFPKIRIYTEMIDHKGWTFAGLIKDFFNKFKFAAEIERSAVIADQSWDDAMQLADQLTAGEMRRFSPRQESEAQSWIRHASLIQD